MDQLRKWRQDLHQIPEIGLQEYKTSAYIKQELIKMGYEPEEVVGTGLIVHIDYGHTKSLAFRSDMDALMITEANDVSYVSLHTGCMHACGHDGHMSALLGFAKRLTEINVPCPYNIVLVFQPAEESPGAARLIVETGILQKYNVQAVYGMHLMPFIDEGKIACKSGPLMAMCGELDVKIEGKASHAGLPHEGIDSITIAGQLLQQYSTVVSRMTSPFSPVVLHVGTIQGGSARNAVASQVTMSGTVRCYSEQQYQDIYKQIDNINKGMELAYGCTITWTCPALYPPVINDARLYDEFKSHIDENHYIELDEALMLAEDFSFYQTAFKGVFFYLGTKSEQFHSGLHTETFNFNEDVLMKAVDLYEKIAFSQKEG